MSVRHIQLRQIRWQTIALRGEIDIQSDGLKTSESLAIAFCTRKRNQWRRRRRWRQWWRRQRRRWRRRGWQCRRRRIRRRNQRAVLPIPFFKCLLVTRIHDSIVVVIEKWIGLSKDSQQCGIVIPVNRAIIIQVPLRTLNRRVATFVVSHRIWLWECVTSNVAHAEGAREHGFQNCSVTCRLEDLLLGARYALALCAFFIHVGIGRMIDLETRRSTFGNVCERTCFAACVQRWRCLSEGR